MQRNTSTTDDVGAGNGARDIRTDRLQEVSRAVRDAGAEARRTPERTAMRAPVRAIDARLDELERLNLAGGASAGSPRVVAWLAEVEEEVGFAAPRWVHEVPDTVALHAAVLRWQGSLLDRCHPERSALEDSREDPLDLLFLRHLGLEPFPLVPRRVVRVRRRVA